MLIVRGALLLVAFALFSTGALAADAKDCKLKQYASLDLGVLGNGFLIVPVTIQGSSVGLILNTASALSILTASTARLLALPLKPMPAGAKVRAGTTTVEQMAIANGFAVGGARFKSAEFIVISDDALNPPSVGAASPVGMLGMDVLGHFDVELDVSKRKMNLFSQDHCPGHVVYWADAFDSAPIRMGTLGELYFPMQLEGKKIETTLGTGNVTTTLSTDVTRKLFGFDSHSSDIETETDATGATTARYRAMKLSGEGIQIVNAHIMLIDRPPHDYCSLGSSAGAAAYEGCLGVHPLKLGLNVLKKLHLYIATKEKVLYFTPADAHR
jgi:hypothetical protein